MKRSSKRNGKKRSLLDSLTDKEPPYSSHALVPLAGPAAPAEALSKEELEGIRSKYLEIYSDPTNTLELSQISARLKVDPRVLLRLKADPAFVLEARMRFQELLPLVGMDVLKASISQAKGGSSAAIRTVLEALQMIQSKNGANVNLFLGSGCSTQDGEDLSQLSDADLEREISSLFKMAYPADVVLSGGQVRQREAVAVMEIEDEKRAPAASDDPERGVDGAAQEDPPVCSPGGADPEAG